MKRYPQALLAMLALSTACASTKPTEAREDLAELVDQRAGVSDVFSAEVDEWSAEQVRERVDDLLDSPLTVDSAMKIALLNNRGLLAHMEELGIAQAELVEAGLLENPVVGGDLVISTRGNGLGGGLALSQSLLSAFLIPAKRKLAKAQLQRSIVEVSDEVLELVNEVRSAHAEVHSALASRALHTTLVQAAEVADELAQRQQDAGNLTDLQRGQVAAALDEARLDLAEHQLELVEAREHLNRLLGLWGDQTSWKLAKAPTLPERSLDLRDLESRGIRQRLDLSAARFEVESMELALKLRRRGLIPMIEGGVEAGNEVGDDEGHEWVVGPSLSVEIPIFDPGHADLARLGAMLRQSQHHLQQRAIEARSKIRVGRERLVLAHRRAQYLRDVVVPRHDRLGGEALLRYNAMLIGAYDLLEIQSGAIEARIELAEAERDYWVARAELERAVGGQLPEQ